MVRHTCLRLGQSGKGWDLKNHLNLARLPVWCARDGQLLHCCCVKPQVQPAENTAWPSHTWIYMAVYFSRQLLVLVGILTDFSQSPCPWPAIGLSAREGCICRDTGLGVEQLGFSPCVRFTVCLNQAITWLHSSNCPLAGYITVHLHSNSKRFIVIKALYREH